MNIVKKGLVKSTDRFISDKYGKRIHVGAFVSFQNERQVLKGQVVDLTILNIKSENKEEDQVTLKILVKEKETENIFEIRSLSNVIVN